MCAATAPADPRETHPIKPGMKVEVCQDAKNWAARVWRESGSLTHVLQDILKANEKRSNIGRIGSPVASFTYAIDDTQVVRAW